MSRRKKGNTVISPAVAVAKPWYREPAPWLLAFGPIVAVVAGLYTWHLAASTSDGLVAEDYYKQGLAAAQTIARSEHATALGLLVHLQADAESVRVRLVAKPELTRPASLKLTLSHPTRAGMDKQIELAPTAQGDAYIARLRMPESGHWLMLIEDQAQTWRVLGNVQLPVSGEVVLGEGATAAVSSAKP
jgi:uncharacterized protein